MAKRDPRQSLPTYLHGATVDQEAIELLRGLVGDARLLENDSRDATALSLGPIGDSDFLDRAYGLAKVGLRDGEGAKLAHYQKRSKKLARSRAEKKSHDEVRPIYAAKVRQRRASASAAAISRLAQSQNPDIER